MPVRSSVEEAYKASRLGSCSLPFASLPGQRRLLQDEEAAFGPYWVGWQAFPLRARPSLPQVSWPSTCAVFFDAFTHLTRPLSHTVHGVWGSLKTGPWAPLFFHSRMCNVVRPSTRRSSEGLKQQADAAAAL